MGLAPALVWWYLAIYSNHYHVSLARNHAHAEVTVYRGRSEAQMQEGGLSGHFKGNYDRASVLWTRRSGN